MQYAREDRLKIVCGLAADDQDLKKLLVLVQENNNLIEERERHPTNANSAGLWMLESEKYCLGVQEVPYDKSHFQEWCRP
jgi:hypothetical protein